MHADKNSVGQLVKCFEFNCITLRYHSSILISCQEPTGNMSAANESILECSRKPACSRPNDSILAESVENAEANESEKELHRNSAERESASSSAATDWNRSASQREQAHSWPKLLKNCALLRKKLVRRKNCHKKLKNQHLKATFMSSVSRER